MKVNLNLEQGLKALISCIALFLIVASVWAVYDQQVILAALLFSTGLFLGLIDITDDKEEEDNKK